MFKRAQTLFRFVETSDALKKKLIYTKLTNEVINRCYALIPTKEERQNQQRFIHNLSRVLCVPIEPFGSYVSQLSLRGKSDMDVAVRIKEEHSQIFYIKHFTRELRKAGYSNVIPIPKARIPIVKFYDRQTNIHCDLSINNLLGVENSKLLYTYASLDNRFKLLSLILKDWARECCLQLSSYGIVLLIIHFLQQRNVLPILQDLDSFEGKAPKKKVLYGYNCTYFRDIQNFKKRYKYELDEVTQIGQLFMEFFQYYSEFNFDKNLVSIRRKNILPKDAYDWNKYSMCIEDPFQTDFNVGRLMHPRHTRIFQYECEDIYTYLRDEYFDDHATNQQEIANHSDNKN